MLDCAIIGAGPAGAAAALKLAQAGYAVQLIERHDLPHPRPGGGGVSPAIGRWLDLDFDAVIATRVNRVRFTWQLSDPIEVTLKTEPMWMVQREHFDALLVERAQAAGATLQTQTTATAARFNGRAWQLTTSQGEQTARYVIVASGSAATIAGLPRSPGREAIAAALTVAQPPSQAAVAQFDFGTLKNGFIWNFPQGDRYTISGAIVGGKGKPTELRQALTHYAQQLGLTEADYTYRERSLRLWGDRQPLHAENVLLAGDAAGLADPLLGEGIRPAILSGIRAATAIMQALAGETGAIASYSQAIYEHWGSDMVLAQRLAGLFYKFPKLAYKVGVKRPAAANIMSQILCGELRYSDVTDKALQILKKSFLPGFGG
ncbi:MAG: geranylgeranyl reductase family protein [Spirulinaceae cyanobacterium RM2_2_10]|nr:geranylgeranyl reductase family protein [Spirulinaceae cyanobacterium SM2_1_0]NJO21562.1 geranylgeranyl reductase family protein [Spirulinaceae cyanobacterium RM2_2_10]